MSQCSIVSFLNQFKPAGLFPLSCKSGEQCGVRKPWPVSFCAVLLRVFLKVSGKKGLVPLRNKIWSLASTKLQNSKEAWFSIH